MKEIYKKVFVLNVLLHFYEKEEDSFLCLVNLFSSILYFKTDYVNTAYHLQL